jgi:hypothetical protein
MKLHRRGGVTSAVEVLNISPHGIWLLVKDREYFLPYDDFPWFKDARLAEIQQVQLLHGHHLHWPELDVDLELDSLDQVERYPLTDHATRRGHEPTGEYANAKHAFKVTARF